MGLADRQELPARPAEKSDWSLRKLFGGTTAVSVAFTKVFVSPFEWLLTFCLIIIAGGELSGANLSQFFYCVAVVLLFCVIMRRVFNAAGELPKEATDHEPTK